MQGRVIAGAALASWPTDLTVSIDAFDEEARTPARRLMTTAAMLKAHWRQNGAGLGQTGERGGGGGGRDDGCSENEQENSLRANSRAMLVLLHFASPMAGRIDCSNKPIMVQPSIDLPARTQLTVLPVGICIESYIHWTHTRTLKSCSPR